MSRVVSQHRLWAIGAVGLVAVLAWLASPTSEDGIVQVANRDGPAQAKPLSADFSAALASSDRQTSAFAQPVPTTGGQRTPASFAAVPISVSAPQNLQVGEQNELVVSVGANAGVSEISFTLQFDPNVLQVRAGTEGGWAAEAGSDGRFVAEIPDAADRVQIRSAVPGQRASTAAGGVAIVHFQAVAPGTTSVMIADVVVKDRAGGSLASTISASNLQVTVDSGPPPQSVAQRLTVAEEAPTDAASDGD